MSIEIQGVRLFSFGRVFTDERGVFQKTYLKTHFPEFDVRESFVSFSKKSVFRGMHFQMPPHDLAKLVCCLSGEVIDYILDLRKDSKTYGKVMEVPLDSTKSTSLFIPKGCAHGFFVTSIEGAWMEYLTTHEYVAESDTGILYSSCGIQLPISNPLLSQRDRGFVSFENFVTPFHDKV